MDPRTPSTSKGSKGCAPQATCRRGCHQHLRQTQLYSEYYYAYRQSPRCYLERTETSVCPRFTGSFFGQATACLCTPTSPESTIPSPRRRVMMTRWHGMPPECRYRFTKSNDRDRSGKLAADGERERASAFTFPPRSVEQAFGGVSAFFASGPDNRPICFV